MNSSTHWHGICVARRLKVYRELFYGTIEGLLAGSFPVMRQTLGELRWHARVRDFYANYRSQTPLFTEVAEAFIDYLQGVEPDAPWQLEPTTSGSRPSST